ncbi:iron chelate uptake ABC transporter family permease subunit [Xenorhabdus sp. XENO-7]|uniref:Iron chelate uptake ABC transporter family permease subunit n=1 Tax=Xenorhabdus aichiensis TaxID=3025874 RepID=A0ABT5M4Z5_9GAMM|nr:iron chelate uptake ABC transporter family permease subunit [Xenorhabdus aichiensis]MDC9622030.1 iron chelate uptake ABC transporter family permease subunit [Xenorhabdus aichiensis]
MPKMLQVGNPEGWINGRIPLRVLLVNTLQLFLIMLLALFAVYYGTLKLPFWQIWQAFQGEGDPGIIAVVTQWRAPRVAIALVVGAALAISGVIFQSVIRNPLSSPDIMGFSTGAWTGVLITLIFLNGGYYQMTLGALIGGSLTAALIYLLAWRQGIHGFRLIIVGIAISAMLTAVNTWLIVTGSLEHVMSAALWGNGSLNGITWQKSASALFVIPLLTFGAFALAKSLKIMEMGDDKASALGCNVETNRMQLILYGILLTAVVTATTGPISFISLAAPQIARRLTGTSYVPLFSAAMTGALLLLTADLVAQHTFSNVQLPVGAVTVSIGGIYLIWLLIREARQ